QDIEAIQRMALSLPVVADLSRADALVFCRTAPDELIIVSEAKPWSVSAVHADPMVGKRSHRQEEPVIWKTWDKQRYMQGNRPGTIMGATTTQDAYPFFHAGRMVAAVSFESNETVRNRHRRRSPVILKSISMLHDMLLKNEIDLSGLSRTSERDALIVVDPQGHIQYMSGTAESLYQKLGFRANLLKRKIDELGTNEAAFFAAMQTRQACEFETREQELT